MNLFRACFQRRAVITALTLPFFLALPFQSAMAQAWPSKPMRLIVGFAAGGTTDLIGRIVADGLKERLNQPLVVENRPGATGLIALEFASKQVPDGYTFIVAPTSMATLPVLNPNATYSPTRDFTPVGGIAIAPFFVMVRSDFPAGNLREFIAYVKANPGKINVATSGNASFDQLAGMKFALATGLEMVWIPQKGEAGALPELASGRTDAAFLQWGAAGPYIRSGRIRLLATLSATRHPALPDILTAGEQGTPVEGGAWFGLFSPAGLPRPIVNTMNRELNAILQSRETADRIRGIFQEPMILSPEQLGGLVVKSAEEWTRVIKATNIKVQ